MADLAPLHNPPALEGIEAADEVLPAAAHVAVFDTTFFASLPRSEFIYPLPYEWYTTFGVRRFGFHGISHAYCADRAAELMRRDSTDLRLVICHLGNGCSATAVRDGVAVATTMSFTPIDGLMMGTRPGSIDPGILTYLQRNRGMSAKHLEHELLHASGLLGVSGISSDYRQVEVAARDGDDLASLALKIYANRVRATIGALVVTLGNIDALIFLPEWERIRRVFEKPCAMAWNVWRSNSIRIAIPRCSPTQRSPVRTHQQIFWSLELAKN